MPWTTVCKNRAEFENAFPQEEGVRGLTYADAILEAAAGLMEEDKRVFVIGQGVDDEGGVFGTTKGLHKRFGKDRCIDTALAENGVTGIAVGAAVCGMRPMLVHMRMDFIPLSRPDNKPRRGGVHVGVSAQRLSGRYREGWGSAAQHSQSQSIPPTSRGSRS